MTQPPEGAGSTGGVPVERTGALLREGADLLATSGSETPRLDAELLLGHAVGVGRTVVLAHPEAPVGADAARRYRADLDATCDGGARGLPARAQGVLRPGVRGGRSRADPTSRNRAPRRARRGRGHASAGGRGASRGRAATPRRGRRHGERCRRGRARGGIAGAAGARRGRDPRDGYLARCARAGARERGRACGRGPRPVRGGGPAAGW